MVTVTIAGDNQLSRPRVPFLHDDLVSDTATGGVKVHAVLFCERLDLFILGEVGRRLILDIVIECKNGLPWIMKARAREGDEFGYYGPGVVVGHAV